MSPQDRMSIKEVSDYIGIGVNTLQRRTVRERLGIPISAMTSQSVPKFNRERSFFTNPSMFSDDNQ